MSEPELGTVEWFMARGLDEGQARTAAAVEAGELVECEAPVSARRRGKKQEPCGCKGEKSCQCDNGKQRKPRVTVSPKK